MSQLLITERGDLTDPAVIVIDLKWMRKLDNYDSSLFSFFVSSLFSSDPWKNPASLDATGLDEDEIDNIFGSAHSANVDIKLAWINHMQEMIVDGWGQSKWDWLRKNVPMKVFDGWDMAIGGEESYNVFREILNDKPDADELIIVTEHEDVISALAEADDDLTFRFVTDDEREESGSIVIEPFTYDCGLQTSDQTTGTNLTLIPNGIYRLANLSDVMSSYPRAAINYTVLRL